MTPRCHRCRQMSVKHNVKVVSHRHVVQLIQSNTRLLFIHPANASLTNSESVNSNQEIVACRSPTLRLGQTLSLICSLSVSFKWPVCVIIFRRVLPYVCLILSFTVIGRGNQGQFRLVFIVNTECGFSSVTSFITDTNKCPVGYLRQ